MIASANESYIYKTWEDPFFIDRIVQFYYLYLDDHLFRLKYERKKTKILRNFLCKKKKIPKTPKTRNLKI